MNNDINQKLNSINKTCVKDLDIKNNDIHFGNGKIKVCNIKMINTIYQFIICNTNKLTNKLIFRYLDKVWSNYYLELNFINDSKYFFNLDNKTLLNNKHYNLLLKNNIKSIILLKDNTLLINNKNTRKEK